MPRSMLRPAAVAAATVAAATVALAAAACSSTGPGKPAGTPGGTSVGAATPGRTGTAAPGTGTSSPSAVPPGATASPAGAVPRPAHTVIVVMENHGYGQVIGSPDAPYINSLARVGALFTNAHAVTHPSEPNYLALFSGSTQGVTDDSCPHQFNPPNLASELLAAGDTFSGYSEGLPGTGSPVCTAGGYARKHVPWANFTNVPASDSKPFTAFPDGSAGRAFPPGVGSSSGAGGAGRDYARLPTVSFVIPDLCDDMHDCPVLVGDGWLRDHIGPYASWAMTHNSLLIVTWDENDGSPGNQIPLIFAGQPVKPGRYGQPVTHYNVLSTLEAAYGLSRIGHAAGAAPISGDWK